MKVEKVSDNEIKIIKIEERTKDTTYCYEDLLMQRANIVKQKEDFIAERNKEIAEVDAILAECEKAGITTKQDIKETTTQEKIL